MSDLIPFQECIARPAEEGKTFPLSRHLLRVKEFMEKKEKNDAVLARLKGLAGLCHDAPKAHVIWQEYISGRRKQRPNHAPEGAYLFSYLGYKMLKNQEQWERYKIYWLWLTRDLADHHGGLKNIAANHWIGCGQWQFMDLPGLRKFISSQYSELQDTEITVESLEKWVETVYDVFEEAMDTINLGYAAVKPPDLMRKLQEWRDVTAALIAGDRFDVREVKPSWLDRDDHRENIQVLEKFCRAKRDLAFSKVRIEAQQIILKQLKENPREMIYTLEMPTGYGKTITALHMASWLGQTQGYRKVLYVAPYLSILEQNSKVFEESMGRLVMEHHSLAFLDTKNETNDSSASATTENLSSSQLAVEAWANAIVCTSFQQFFKALFPGRAQDTLRRAYLHDSVVIIDEPQIISPASWNVFLCALEAVAKYYNLRVIFLSATMPPFKYGLSREPARLAVKAVEQIERYRVVHCEPMDEKRLAEFLLSRPEKTQAAILNTIADAYLVYNEMKGRHDNLRLIHGLMAPLHKRVEIAKIQDWLENNPKETICVISTQILEAGVDLSFQHLARALPILPSAVQAAGRVNRHFEGTSGAPGTLSLFTFLRGGEKDTRSSVYRDFFLRKITDDLLQLKEEWKESEMLQLIKDYYQKMFAHNTYEATKQAIKEAYEGNWPVLANFQPFENDYLRLPLFVPWRPTQHDDHYLPPKFTELQKRQRLYTPEEIYEKYMDRQSLAALPLEGRKEFMILFHHYVINVPFKLAMTLVGKDAYINNKVPMLTNADDYDPISGLAERHVKGYDNFI